MEKRRVHFTEWLAGTVVVLILAAELLYLVTLAFFDSGWVGKFMPASESGPEAAVEGSVAETADAKAVQDIPESSAPESQSPVASEPSGEDSAPSRDKHDEKIQPVG